MKNYTCIVALFLFITTTSACFAQKTPEDLGKFVFTVFKQQNLTSLDTLTPTSNDIIKIYTQLDSTLAYVKKPDFPRKYAYHDKLFKEKFKEIMTDTTELNIDWKSASLITVKYSEENIKLGSDSLSQHKAMMVNYLDVNFSTTHKKYMLQFRRIYQVNGIWKLGEHVRVKEIIEK